MATNPFFDSANTTGLEEQKLIDDVTQDLIKQAGTDVYYIPRHLAHVDTVLNEDVLSSFETAYPIEMYMSDVDTFGDVIGQTGLQIKDTIVLHVSVTRFEEETRLPKPLAGDLIFFPLSKDLFEITFVETEDNFYQTGKLFTYKLMCEVFEYSHEAIDTGIDDVDTLPDILGVNTQGEPITPSPTDDSGILETEGDSQIDDSEENVFGTP